MGIQGLLPQVKKVTRPVSAADLRGLTCAVDGYGWLHKGVHGCAADLGMGKQNDSFVWYCLNRIDTLVSQGARVLMVFDGGPLPSKEGTELDRQASRDEARETAHRLMREGNATAAYGFFAKSVDVSPLMAAKVISAMRHRYGESRAEVDWIVAPYEADAQLAYLSIEGLCDAVISEDSDNLPYGVSRTVFKWDGRCGEQVLLKEVLGTDMGKPGLDLQGFTQDMLLYMCILCG